VDEWTRRLVEALLDPQGKWYDTAGRDRLLKAAPELERIPDEPTPPSHSPNANRHPDQPDVSQTLDEWEPA